MNEQKNKKIIIASIIIAIVILILLMINIFMTLNENRQAAKIENNISSEGISNQTTDAEILELQELDEYSRIVKYFNKYISYIENGNYEAAYQLLYPEFKQTYFDTLDKYVEYVKNKYPIVISVQYDGVQRLGQYYVLNIVVIDALNMDAEQAPSFEQKFILYENDFNDFVLSFQAE